MIETVIVVGVLLLLVVVASATLLLGWQALTLLGAACALLGFVVGVPAGAYYHVRLHRELAPRGLLPERWWWSPVRYHRHLEDEERARVLPWFYAGGTGFLLILTGCAAVLLGVLLSG